MKKYKILLIGNGAREHAIAHKLIKSKYLSYLYCIGFNLGFINNKITILPFEYEPKQHSKIIVFCKENFIDFVIIGNEKPIFCGLSTELEKNNIKVIAPTQQDAELEHSKFYAKNFMNKYQIPHAKYKLFEDINKAQTYCTKHFCDNSEPLVIKADGEALGKGVIIVKNIIEAKQTILQLSKNYGPKIIIEEYLEGNEISFFILSDGKNYIPFGYAKDYKTINDHNKGENTGGMGAYSAKNLLTAKQILTIKNNIIAPTLQGCKTYRGILFFGLILTKNGPKLLEYNVRLGDPEAQVILPRLKTDLIKIFIALLNQKLNKLTIKWSKQEAISVVLANKGYPLNYQKNLKIDATKLATLKQNITIYYANILPADDQYIYLTNGGRLLNIVALNLNKEILIQNAYKAIKLINFKQAHYRNDIGS